MTVLTACQLDADADRQPNKQRRAPLQIPQSADEGGRGERVWNVQTSCLINCFQAIHPQSIGKGFPSDGKQANLIKIIRLQCGRKDDSELFSTRAIEIRTAICVLAHHCPRFILTRKIHLATFSWRLPTRTTPSRTSVWGHTAESTTPACFRSRSSADGWLMVDSHWRPAVRSPVQYGPERARKARLP